MGKHFFGISFSKPFQAELEDRFMYKPQNLDERHRNPYIRPEADGNVSCGEDANPLGVLAVGMACIILGAVVLLLLLASLSNDSVTPAKKDKVVPTKTTTLDKIVPVARAKPRSSS